MERMREMNARAAKSTGAGNMPPVPPFVRVPRQENAARTDERAKTPPPPPPPPQNGGLQGLLDIPFLKNLTGSGDTALILGLLLILISEKADKKLLFALVYILL